MFSAKINWDPKVGSGRVQIGLSDSAAIPLSLLAPSMSTPGSLSVSLKKKKRNQKGGKKKINQKINQYQWVRPRRRAKGRRRRLAIKLSLSAVVSTKPSLSGLGFFYPSFNFSWNFCYVVLDYEISSLTDKKLRFCYLGRSIFWHMGW